MDFSCAEYFVKECQLLAKFYGSLKTVINTFIIILKCIFSLSLYFIYFFIFCYVLNNKNVYFNKSQIFIKIFMIYTKPSI